ncbi:MAG: hypothetical protein FWD25_10710 [Clostridia bacterium]|nr:hypothetical protein [Clostridia bacterium]
MTDDLFLSHINHEIRPPMNAIIDMSVLLSRTSLDSMQQEYVKSITSASDSLRKIAGDMLGIHTPTTEGAPLREQAYDFCALIGNLMDVVTSLARGKGLACVVSLAPDIPAQLIGDALRLKRTLLGLLDNAVQHAGSGHIKLEITVKRESEQNVLLQFRIEDCDIGLRSSFRIRQRCASDITIAPLPNPEGYRVLLLASGVRGSACRDMFASLGVAVAHCTAAERAGMLLRGNFTHVFYDYETFHTVLEQRASIDARRVAILRVTDGRAPNSSLFDTFVFDPPLVSDIAQQLRDS